MGFPGSTTVNRHPRFTLSLIFILLVTSLLLLAPRHGETPLESLRSLWNSKDTTYASADYNPAVALYGDLKSTLEYSERIYQDTIRRRYALIEEKGGEGLEGFPPKYSAFYTLWDFFTPAFSCPFPVTRVGALGDGGKWVCGFERVINQRDCVVYSSGVNIDSSFEREILDGTSNCKIYGYDYSVENWGPQLRNVPEYESRIQFKPWKLAPASNPHANPPEYSIQGLMAKNGHQFIDILKLDIENSEFVVLDSLFKEYKGRSLPFGQLQLEIHLWGKKFSDFLHWWERLEEAGLRPFWTEPNLPDANFHRGSPVIAEWSFINIRGNHILLTQPEKSH